MVSSGTVRRGVQCNGACSLPNQQRKLFVGGLAHKTTTADLTEYFSHFGHISDSVVLRWPDGVSRGFGYVTFWEDAAIDSVLQCRHVIAGQKVEVKRAVPSTNKLFVGHLPPWATDADLFSHFKKCGTVSSAVVMMDVATGKARGFGFVCFAPGAEGKAAMDVALSQKHRLKGHLIDAKHADASKEKAVREMADTDIPTSDSDVLAFSDEDSSSESFSSAPAMEYTASSASSSSKQRHDRNKFSFDLGEPQKVSFDGAGAQTITTAGRPRTIFEEPVWINLKFGSSELFNDAAARKAHADEPAKVVTSLLSAGRHTCENRWLPHHSRGPVPGASYL